MLTDETALKHKLSAIVQADYTVPEGQSAYDLLAEMLPAIGSPDPELRDGLIYSIAAHWLTRNSLTPAEYQEFTQRLLSDDYVFYRIGSVDDDSVFKRSFSILWLPLIVFAHRQQEFLSPSQIGTITEQTLRYLAAERDLRGYVNGQGWAHATAHTADLLDELLQCPTVQGTLVQAILDAILDKIAQADQVFSADEDERLCVAVITALKADKYSTAAFTDWLARLIPYVQQEWNSVAYGQRRMNIKSFLRSLYFQMGKHAGLAAYLSIVEHTLQHVHRFS